MDQWTGSSSVLVKLRKLSQTVKLSIYVCTPFKISRAAIVSIYCQIISSQSWTFWLNFVVAFVHFLCHLHNPYYYFTTPAMVTSGQEPSSDIGSKVRTYWLLTFRSDGLGLVLFWIPQKYLIPQTITCYLNVQWGSGRCICFIHQLIAFPRAMVWCLVELQLNPVNFLISSEFLIFVHFFHV